MTKAARNRSGVTGGLCARALCAALGVAAGLMAPAPAHAGDQSQPAADGSSIYILGSGGMTNIRIPSPGDSVGMTSNGNQPAFHFTPRGLRLPSEFSPASSRRTAFAPEDAAREGSMWLDFSGGAEAPQGVGVSLGAGVSSDHASAGNFSGAADSSRSTTTFAARVGVSRLSFGGGVRSAAVATGPTALLSQPDSLGYDLDMSYAFDEGSVTLSRFFGRDDEFLLRAGDRPRERLSLSGKYLVGYGLDFTAALAYSGDTVAPAGDASQPGNDGWAMLTGLKLSF